MKIPTEPGQSIVGAARPPRRESLGVRRRPPDVARARIGAPTRQGKAPGAVRRRARGSAKLTGLSDILRMTAMSYQMLVFLRAWSGIEASPSELLERRVSAAIAELEEERAMLLEARAILTS